ncbi:histone acetyltransferase KAT7 [Aricia agestis]|uniref:histone acetyltransferase KAT7 n=1 Tax=Aricia agestis TaxID=91739 RepID=UPI001C20A64F|nr:histone acetyltransferase KAT7 [Aricia agestis]
MTNLDASNSSTDSSSGSTSDSSSSESSTTSSGSASSSSDSESSASETPAVATLPKSPKQEDEPKKKEEPKPRRNSKPKATSSSEDEVPKVSTPKPIQPRRRCSTKPKNAASVLARGKVNPRAVPGGKSKAISKTIPKALKAESNASKKKSIFSPDNSSESDADSKDSKNKDTPKGSPSSDKKSQKSSEEKAGTSSPMVINDDSNSKESAAKKRSSRSNGPPPKKSSDGKSASSCTSSQSSVESVSSESDSEPTIKKEDLKTGKSKPPPVKTKQEVTGKSGDSGDSVTGTMTRKLTRSLSARVSRIVNATKTNNTDTDSEPEEKVNEISKDDKRLAKARAAIARSPAAPLTPSGLLEKRCPVRDCDSTGHLGGKAAKHFTWDACPMYHNVTAAWCVAAAEERAAAAATRRRALAAIQQRPRAMPTIEQRAYQLKVKDMRSKWKGSQELRSMPSNDEHGEEREPVLEGFAPDYDLRLFRDAQALAAVKIEEELGDIANDKCTRYIHRYVVMGRHMMEAWYQSPYPGAAGRVPRLYVCEFCLAHHRCGAGAARHRAKCLWRHPPGDEVYRKDNLSVWQVDGRKHKQYCQQLCLLAKFFLDHKTLYYDVEPFLFYVMTCADEEGCHIVGYFSKEKNSFLNYNVSCILTLPPYQRQGYGRLLIDFSYLLTKVEGKVGSPETPLSDLGLISYRSYWKEALLKRLCSAPGPTLCIRDLSKDLAIASSDIVSTLQERGLMKYWKGKHIVLKKQEVLEDAMRRAARARCVDASCLRWWGGGGAAR